MSLIKCPDCKNPVSDNAENCIKCGYPIKNLLEKGLIDKKTSNNLVNNSTSLKNNNGCGKVIIAIVIILFILFLIGQCSNENTVSATYEMETIKLSKEDSLKNIVITDSINKQNKIEEENFLKTKAGKIYKKHPTWSKEDCQSLANKKIWIGMQYEMLVYLRGRPDDINTSNYGSGIQYQACWHDYDPGCFYFEEDQIIKSYN